jgi:hypothetical protein
MRRSFPWTGLALLAVALWFAVFAPLVCRSVAAEPVHAYLRGEDVIHYSIEAGPRAFIRRGACRVSDNQCRLARLPTYFRLPDRVAYPIRIKETGSHCWSVWPGERFVPPGALPFSPRKLPTPEFVCMRLDPNDFGKSMIPLKDFSTANRGNEVPTAGLIGKYAEDYPISAMFHSRYLDITEVDGAPRWTVGFPVSPYSPKFADWAKEVQPEFNRFASYDLLADADGGCRLFLVMEGSENRRYILPPSKERRMYELQVVPSVGQYSQFGLWTWRVVDHYPSEFVNRFIVADSTSQRWFVTGDGKLYRLVSQGDEKAVRQVKVRDDQPIQALLEEAGHPGRCFSFTGNGWFELKEPIVYHDFELGSFQADSPMPTLIRCATEVRKLFPALTRPTQE